MASSPSPADALNPDGLPIGFAIDKDFVDPVDKSAVPVVGLNCSACHTGELYYGKHAVLVEGAPGDDRSGRVPEGARTGAGFQHVVSVQVGRYGRFEQRVLGPNATDQQKAELQGAASTRSSSAALAKRTSRRPHIYDNAAGFMRTDALTRIGNQVFAADTNNDDNYAVANAPVRFPQIWDASWFNWVQYNSSIADPLARNIGEALGVRAVVKLYGPDAGQFENSINMQGCGRSKNCSPGPARSRVSRRRSGRRCFRRSIRRRSRPARRSTSSIARHCHLPPHAGSLGRFERRPTTGTASRSTGGRARPAIGSSRSSDIKLEEIGTDPHEATDFNNRKAALGDLSKGVVSASVGLDLVTRGIANRFFRKQNIRAEERACGPAAAIPGSAVRAELIYKARPLNGIWAVAPYLHNGSVPNLDALLSPDDSSASETFWMGSKQFDPVKVGYSGVEMKGATLFDTARPAMRIPATGSRTARSARVSSAAR